MTRGILIIALILFPLGIMAQREKKVEAEYTYFFPETVTPEVARRTALDRAKIKAIADEFGTIVTQSNTSFVKNENGVSSIDFQSLGSSDVKGEWIETIGEPEYEKGISDDGQMYWIKCTVKGRIREIVSAQTDLIVKVLRNGTEERFEGYDFKGGDKNTGDDMYLYFKSPQNGFLTVYLINEVERKAYCLLPYMMSEDPAQKIKHDKEYVFFSKEKAPENIRNIVDRLFMTCNGDFERNDLYVIFSPNSFVKANSAFKSDKLPRELSWEDFNKWLVNLRKHDNAMVVEKKTLTIKK